MAKKLSQFDELTTADNLDLIVGHSPAAGKNIVIKKENLLKEVNESLQAGTKGYPDKATMDGDTSQTTGTIGIVMNDSTASNNGYYRWDDSAGNWVKRDEFYATDPQVDGPKTSSKSVAPLWVSRYTGRSNRVSSYHPFKEGSVGDSDTITDEVYNGIIDIQLNGTKSSNNYALLYIRRNNTTYGWELRIYENTGSGPANGWSHVASFITTSNPEPTDDIVTIHDLSEISSSGITGRIAVRWSSLTDGCNYDLQENLVLSDAVWNNNNKGYINLQDALNETEIKLLSDLRYTEYSVGKNLFNINDQDVTTGYYVNSATGVLSSNSGYNVTGYIPVDSNTDYYLSYKNQIAFYDKDKNYISGDNTVNSSGASITTPANAKYLRCSVSVDKWDIFQVEQGTSGTSYEPYQISFYKKGGEEILIDDAITLKKVLFGDESLPIGKNRFNKNDPDVTTGKYVYYDSDNLYDSANYTATGYIPVEPSKDYAVSEEGNQLAFYDKNKNYVSGIQSTSNPITVPAGCYYIRYSVSDDINTFQLEEGNTITSYEGYIEGNALKSLNINAADLFQFDLATFNSSKNKVKLSFPSKQYLLSGYENSRYYKAIMRRWIPDKYFCRFEGSEFNNYKNFARVTNPSNATTGAKVKVYDDEFREVDSKTFDILIGDQATDNGAIVVNAVGDSFTDTPYYLQPAATLPSISFDAMRSYSASVPDSEGRGGWTLNRYFNDIYGTPYTNGFSPFIHPVDPYVYYGSTNFWKDVVNGVSGYQLNGYSAKATEIGFNSSDGYKTSPSQNDVMWVDANGQYEYWDGSAWTAITASTLNFSFNYGKYLSTWNITTPDIVTVMLGLNDFRTKNNEQAVETLFNATWKSQMESFITSVHAANANAKFAILLPTSTMATLNNNGDVFTQKQNAMMWKARDLIINNFDERTGENIWVVDTGASLDDEYGFNYSEEAPFSQYSGTETRKIQNNSPHPSIEGYNQLGIPLSGWIQAVR